MHTTIFIDSGRESWDSPKGATASGFGLHRRPWSAEWVLKKNCLKRLKASSTRTFPILSASAVQEMRPYWNSRKDPGRFIRCTFSPTSDSALLVSPSLKSYAARRGIDLHKTSEIGRKPLADRTIARSQPSSYCTCLAPACWSGATCHCSPLE